jgi:hypothetical protein
MGLVRLQTADPPSTTVCRETGIANSTITALIKEDRLMTRSQIETLARYFSVPPAVFLPGNEVPTKAAAS